MKFPRLDVGGKSSMMVWDGNTYVRVRSGGTLPPEHVSIDACALPEYKIMSKSRL